MENSEKIKNISTKRLIIKLTLALALIAFGLTIPKLCSESASEIELWFSEGVFPALNGALGTVFGIFPFSVAEFLLYALILFVLIRVLLQFFGCLRKKIGVSVFLSTLLAFALAGGILLNLFYFTWGFNYFRPSTAELMNLTVTERSSEELTLLCKKLAGDASALREQVNEDENGVFTLPEGYRAYFEQIPAAYEVLGERYPLFSRKVPVAKGVVIGSKGLSYAGISGIFIPFTAEANVNIDQPALLMLSSAAHESAHNLGIAAESGANFVSYLACISSDNPSISYSGTMLALIHSGNTLAKVDADAYRNEVAPLYSDGMRRDLSDYSAYWDTFEGEVSTASTQINDSYLKHNQQESGVKSYGEMVDLLLAYYAESLSVEEID